MIPKIIHYCWFGKKPLPKKYAKYIAGWRELCPDYEVIEWNENNFDINCCDYTREAAETGKWAFVSDVARLDILHKFGGFYLDTDIELLKPLDSLLTFGVVAGFEDESKIHTGIIGAEKGNKLIQEWRQAYEGAHFILENGKLNLKTNVERITESCIRYGLKTDGSLQKIASLTVLPKEYLCPQSPFCIKKTISENTIAWHHFSGSWKTISQKIRELPYFIIGLDNCRKLSLLRKRLAGRIK